MNVLVYGTLRKGEGNYRHFLDGMEPKVVDMLTNFKMYSLGAFPAIVESPDKNDFVVVELYEIDEVILKKLDRLEGYPRFYNRKEVSTVTGNKGWVYYQEEKNADGRWELIPGGDWKKRDGR